MPTVRRYRRWTSQPPLGTPLDPAHPIARSAAEAWPLNEGAGRSAQSAGYGRSTLSIGSQTTWVGDMPGSGLQLYYGASASANATLPATSPCSAWDRAQPWTFAAWILIRSTPPSSNLGPIWSSVNGAASNQGIELGYSSGNLRVVIVNTWSTNYINVSATGTYPLGSLHHVAVSYDGSSSASGVRIYVDGVAVATSTAGDNLSASCVSGLPFEFGTRPSSSFYNYLNIFSPIICDLALSPGEVASLYCNTWQIYAPRPSAWLYGASSGPPPAAISYPAAILMGM